MESILILSQWEEIWSQNAWIWTRLVLGLVWRLNWNYSPCSCYLSSSIAHIWFASPLGLRVEEGSFVDFQDSALEVFERCGRRSEGDVFEGGYAHCMEAPSGGSLQSQLWCINQEECGDWNGVDCERLGGLGHWSCHNLFSIRWGLNPAIPTLCLVVELNT